MDLLVVVATLYRVYILLYSSSHVFSTTKKILGNIQGYIGYNNMWFYQ